MVFSSIIFILYFLPVFLTIYFVTDVRIKNLIVLFASIVFYSWGAPLFIFVILGTTFVDFQLVGLMYRASDQRARKLLLVLSVSMNLGLLFYFKYSLFFIDNINVVLHLSGIRSITWEKLALPIGISFFTFESLTYVVDVYRGVHAPLKKFWDYQLYIILFPKLIAGPIVRYHDIADQIEGRFDNAEVNKVISGFYRFIIGLSKKVIIANSMAVYADRAFQSDVHSLGFGSAWVGILCYTFQIYFDFSGYSDMAIGLLRMIGFEIKENFNQPYTSDSVTDFWRRWHISLGAWMREYLYIPLGGNKVKSKWRMYLNLWIVFLASGLWHGASWSFVIWGAYHGCWLVLEKAWLLKFLEKVWHPIRTTITFFIVLVGWVFFRADSLTAAAIYLQKLFTYDAKPIFALSNDFTFYITIASIFSFIGLITGGQRLTSYFYTGNYSNKAASLLGLICVAFLILDISTLATKSFNPFIYFRF